MVLSMYLLLFSGGSSSKDQVKVRHDNQYVSLLDEDESDTVSSSLSDYLKTAKSCALESGELISEAFKLKKNPSQKSGPNDLVTKTDKESEQLIKNRLKKAFPSHKFIGEEGGDVLTITESPTWIIDPLDGTTNFVHGIPFVAVSIALVLNKKVQVAVVYNPIINEMFTATLGGGTYYNSQQVRVSTESDLTYSLVDADLKHKDFDRISGHVQSVRRLGAASLQLASVAMGRLDAYVENNLKVWDYAAGSLLVTEAGGRVMINGSDSAQATLGHADILSGNPKIVRKLSDIISIE